MKSAQVVKSIILLNLMSLSYLYQIDKISMIMMPRHIRNIHLIEGKKLK